jgi:hypothetical protein
MISIVGFAFCEVVGTGRELSVSYRMVFKSMQRDFLGSVDTEKAFDTKGLHGRLFFLNALSLTRMHDWDSS